MKIKDLILKNWYNLIYIIVVIIYIFQLKSINKILLGKHFYNSWELIKYNDFIALKFFVLAFILFTCGGGLIAKILSDLKNKYKSIEDVIVGLIIIVIICILMILIINYITVPILRAILTITTVVMGAIFLICN